MNLERHRGKCQVCRHAKLAAIEADYLRWQTVDSLRTKYGLPENSLNRHIKAFHLDEKLRRNKLVGQLLSGSPAANHPGTSHPPRWGEGEEAGPGSEGDS